MSESKIVRGSRLPAISSPAAGEGGGGGGGGGGGSKAIEEALAAFREELQLMRADITVIKERM